MEKSQWDAGTAWMLLYIHGKFTMGCRYCLNVAIHTRKVHNGMQEQHSGSTCIPLWTFRVCIATFRQYLHPIVSFTCMHNNIQAVPASQYIHGTFTMGCRYCLNVVIHTRKVYNGMQVLPECCYTYTESLQWDAGTAGSTCIPLKTFHVCIATFRQYLHPIVNFPCIYSNIQAVPASHCELSVSRKVHNGMHVLPECCYRYMESLQWDAGTAWMLLYIHGKFTMECRYCLNVAIDTWKVYNEMQVLPECCYAYTESSLRVCIATFRQ
jgi:hypothetical protein